MNINEDTDTIDGKAPPRQLSIALTYILGFTILFFVIKEIILGLFGWGFGEQFASNFSEWVKPLSLFLLGLIIGPNIQRFYVNPAGNFILPTTNMFSNKKLNDDGGTVFIVYSTGFALKYPWEIKFGPEIQIEREEVHSPRQEDKGFVTTIKGTALEVKMNIMWLPYLKKLSSLLQTRGDHKSVMLQIGTKCQQTFEVFASTFDDAEIVRSNQTIVCQAVLNTVQEFANDLGIKLADISLEKCDYSVEIQEMLNKQRTNEVLIQNTNELIGAGVPADVAARTAAMVLGIPGYEHKSYSLEISPEIANMIAQVGPATMPTLLAYLAAQRQTPPTPTRRNRP